MFQRGLTSISSILSGLTIPDVVPYFLAILGLLVLWEVHAIQVRAGRIQAVDFWNRSGIRMFIHATPSDAAACSVCRGANGMVLLPSVAAKKKFTPLPSPCANPSGCRCLLIGLYGGWREAMSVLASVKEAGGTLWLSEEELEGLFQGDWQKAPGASVDQVSVRLLQALRDEERNAERAIESYRFVIERARSERDTPFQIPSYFRLSDLLERRGRPEEALPVVEQFLKTYDRNSRFSADRSDLAMMTARRTRLMMMVKSIR